MIQFFLGTKGLLDFGTRGLEYKDGKIRDPLSLYTNKGRKNKDDVKSFVLSSFIFCPKVS